MELYKRLKRHSSLLISKKSVIFLINPEKQIFTEFTENTTILSLRKYITHYLNIKYIDILFNGRSVSNDLNLNDLCRNNKKIKRLFFQVINKKEAKRVKEEEKKIKIYKNEINEINYNNYNLNNELLKLKRENSEKKLENKNSAEKCKKINDIYEKQEEEINELKKELTKINDGIKEMNNINIISKTLLIEENNKFEIISKNKIKKSNSVVFLASTYTIIGQHSNSTNDIYNKNQSKEKFEKKTKSFSIDYSTVNSNINNNSICNNGTSNNSEIIIDSNNNNNYICTTESTKKDTYRNIDLIDKDKEIIKKGYNPKYFEINFKSIDKDLLIDNSGIISNIKKWFTIFKYLDINSLLLFSLINKENGICILYYWVYYLNYKIQKIDDRYNIISKQYSTINNPIYFVLPRFAKTAFEKLNNAMYSKTFENPINYFKDEKNYLISAYKILFQLTKIFENEDIINMENDLFLNKMIENMKNKKRNGEPLGNYIQDLILNKMDFSFENMIKINEIMKKYKIDKMNTKEISKIDKTTGVISVIINNILSFFGFFLDEKNKDDKLIQKNNIICELQNNIHLKENYLENINRIKNIIDHKYNIQK